MFIIKDILKKHTSLNLEQIDKFELFAKLLLQWNEKINLTAITDPQEIAIKHFLDCLSVLDNVSIGKNSRCIDVGTGAGFPAVPLMIARDDLDFTLLDSLNKRLVFLKEVCDKLGLNAHLEHKRAEEGSREEYMREKYDFVFSRAVAGLDVLAEYCLPYAKVGGMFVAMKGPNAENEERLASSAIKLLGGKTEDILSLKLLDDSVRNIVIIKKISDTPSAYPRKAVKISKNPL